MPTVRPARPEELPAAAMVYLRSVEDRERRIGRSPGGDFGAADPDREAWRATEYEGALRDLSILHGDDPEAVWVAVAETDGRVVGMAADAVRERQWLLYFLFVDPEHQGRGIGGALLERTHARGVAAGCDVFSLTSSRDPAALTRYLALGLLPQPPTIVFGVPGDRADFPPARWDDGLEAIPLHPGDEVALATLGDLDKAVRGVRRPRDLARWLAEGATGALLSKRETGTPAGYFLVAERSGWEPDVGRIGPVLALDEERVPDVLGRALAAAGTMARPGLAWELLVPGENRRAVPVALAAGFRPGRLQAYFSSAPIGRFDRYLPHDGDLF